MHQYRRLWSASRQHSCELTSRHEPLRLGEASSAGKSGRLRLLEARLLRLLVSRLLRLLLRLLVACLLRREAGRLSGQVVRRRCLLSGRDELMGCASVGRDERAEQTLVPGHGSERTSRALLLGLLLLLLGLERSRLLVLQELAHRCLRVVKPESVVVALGGSRRRARRESARRV